MKLLLDIEGEWKISIRKSSLVDNFMSIDQEKGPVLVAKQEKPAALKGEDLNLSMWLGAQLNHKKVKNVSDAKAVVMVTNPKGKRKRLVVLDDGKITDQQAGDNVINVSLRGKLKGQYDFEIYWISKKKNGRKVKRTGLLTYFVADNNVTVKSKFINATRATVGEEPVEPNRYGLPVKIKSKNPLDGPTNTYAEVWGHNSNNQLSPIGWIGGTVDVKNNIVPFSFHAGWLRQDQFIEPFVLRNIKVYSDENINIVKNHSDITINGFSADLVAPDTANSAEIRYAGQLDEVQGYTVSNEMLFGVDPTELAPDLELKSAGIKRTVKATSPGIGAAAWRTRNPVLFLHGFCDSARVWRDSRVRTAFPDQERLEFSVENDGADVQAYTDELVDWLNEQRNAGRFDRIRGVVAHSQGGMVAANLLQTHQWLFTPSSLVYAPRYQVVSIGSPYNGVSALENGARIRGYIRDKALRSADEVFCGEIPSDFYPSQKWKDNITNYTRSRIHSIYTDGGARDRWWHAASSTWCANRSSNYSLSSWISGNDDGLLRNLDTKGFAGKDSYYPKKCHTPFLTKSGWEPQVDTVGLATLATDQFENFRPYCVNTNDPDGDGWGWENGASCVVPSRSVVYCQSSASDPDGDGYGWENGRSCIVQ